MTETEDEEIFERAEREGWSADSVAYALWVSRHGEPPINLCLVRTCPHRDCVNPEHFKLEKPKAPIRKWAK